MDALRSIASSLLVRFVCNLVDVACTQVPVEPEIKEKEPTPGAEESEEVKADEKACES